MYGLLDSLGYEISENNKLIGKVEGEKVKDRIYDFFHNKYVHPDDTLLFYYSGHGVQSGYVTAVNQYSYHCKLCVPNNATLLMVNKTGSIPSGMAHTANGYTDGYNKGGQTL